MKRNVTKNTKSPSIAEQMKNIAISARKKMEKAAETKIIQNSDIFLKNIIKSINLKAKEGDCQCFFEPTSYEIENLDLEYLKNKLKAEGFRVEIQAEIDDPGTEETERLYITWN